MNPLATRSPVVELRRYTLHAGRRDELIELFDRELAAPQEAAGMRLLGEFRDRDDPDAFVWLRGFASMPERAASLATFYGGPVWREHRDAANATMIDSDDVLLLRPAWGGPDPSLRGERIVATILHPRDGSGDAVVGALGSLDALAVYRTEHAENTYPALPVREGEDVVVVLQRAGADPPAAPRELLERPPRTLRLDPTES